MFGYVKLYKPELKIRDYEVYKAVYCTLCRTLGREYGLWARLFLSYDLTFYVLLRKAVLQAEPDCCVRGRCRFNPLKKCGYISGDGSIFKTAAALTILLAFCKLKDNIRDGGFFKRLSCRLLYPYMLLKFKKAKRREPELEALVSGAVKAQERVENERPPSMDRAADPSARALAGIFSLGIADENMRRVAERFGYCLGRWVYLADAYDDLDKDLKSGNYNPYILEYSIGTPSYDTDEMVKSLRLTASEAALAFNLLDLKQYGDILSNIVYDGLEAEQQRLTKKRGGKADGKSV